MDRQTLRVCSEIVQGPFDHVSNTARRLAKRYVCAASAFSVVDPGCDSSFRTHGGPRNVTHAMVFACVRGFQQSLDTY